MIKRKPAKKFAAAAPPAAKAKPDTLDHVRLALVKESVRKRIFRAILLPQGRIGVRNAYKLHIRVFWKLGEEALDMTVLEANNGDFNGPRLLSISRS